MQDQNFLHQEKRRYDLEDRTFEFARNVRHFLYRIKTTDIQIEDKKQLIRSSGSVGANYIEANEAISEKDFLLRIKICRKEAKESHYWLRLFWNEAGMNDGETLKDLIQEALELTKIFGAIANNYKRKIAV